MPKIQLELQMELVHGQIIQFVSPKGNSDGYNN